MIGAIIGDIVGSKYEYNNYKAKDFEFFDLNECGVTDDSVMSLAVAQGILDSDETGEEIHKAIIRNMKKLGQQYPDADYGPHFIQWVLGEVEEKPYGSTGNGSAMRVSACGFRANSLEEAKELAKASAEVTHNSPGGIRGAEATAAAIYLARTGATKDEIIREIKDNYYDYDFGGEFTVDNEREDYYYHLSCDGTVPYAIAAFVDGNDYEDIIRNAISLGGDSDTMGAIAGGIAEAYYGVPDELRDVAEGVFLDETLLGILRAFEEKYPGVRPKES